MTIVEDIQRQLSGLLLKIMEEYRDEIRDNIRERGLVLTGQLLNSVEARVVNTPFGLRGQIWLNEYGLVWETGITRDKIGTYVGRQRNLLADLTGYMRARGADNPGRAAFATIETWYREGAPTRASRKYSNAPGGERTRFIQRAVESKSQEVEKRIREKSSQVVLLTVERRARQALRGFLA